MPNKFWNAGVRVRQDADGRHFRRKARGLLPVVHPNAALQAEYRRRLVKLVDELAASVEYWLTAAYRGAEPEVARLALDASPARVLQAAVKALRRRWLRRFDALSKDLAQWFAGAAAERSDRQLRAALKRGGITVRFRTSKAVNDVLQAAVAENVALIRSIPTQYLTQVEGAVMRSVQVGRDLGPLAKELREHHGVSRRRAALIARDQNNKATAVITRVRQQELGVERAIWLHSHGGRKPRPSHVKQDGRTYDVAKGWFDPDEGVWTWPGVLVNCRCVSRSIIPGLDA